MGRYNPIGKYSNHDNRHGLPTRDRNLNRHKKGYYNPSNYGEYQNDNYPSDEYSSEYSSDGFNDNKDELNHSANGNNDLLNSPSTSNNNDNSNSSNSWNTQSSLLPFSNKNRKNNKDTITADDTVKAIISIPKVVAFVFPFMGILLISLAALLSFVTLFSNVQDLTSSSKYSYSGYYESSCSNGVTVIKDDIPKAYDYDEYIVGVVLGEVGGFQDIEVYKSLAIAARTFAEKNFQKDGCTISGGDDKQYFVDPTGLDEYSHVKLIRQAVEETKGILIKQNNEVLPEAVYDAFCYKEYDNSYYTLTENQQSQKIPTAWVLENIKPSASVDRIHCPCKGYKKASDWKNSDTYKEWASSHPEEAQSCWNDDGSWKGSGHGHGLSQYGAYYLATEEKKNFEDILKYYYGEDITLTADKKKLTKSITSITNMELKDTSDATALKGKSLSTYLKENGSSIEDLNEYIHSNVIKTGAGTREGVVVAAVSLVNYLYDNFKIKLPYYWDGKYTHIGVNPNFGIETTNSDGYIYSGFDCSGFASWAIINGGYHFSGLSTSGFDSSFSGDSCIITSQSCTGLPGDLINAAAGHVQLIIDVDESQGVYYVAHSGGDTNGGESLNIKVVGMHQSLNRANPTRILHMENYYSNASHVNTNY